MTRHPVAVGYPTLKWTPGVRVRSLVEHWLICHERFPCDRAVLQRVYVLCYEDFVANPQEQLDGLYSFLGLPSTQVTREIRKTVNARYLEKWDRRRRNLLTRLHASRLANQFEERVRHCPAAWRRRCRSTAGRQPP